LENGEDEVKKGGKGDEVNHRIIAVDEPQVAAGVCHLYRKVL
jgi:hypothetical protein